MWFSNIASICLIIDTIGCILSLINPLLKKIKPYETFPPFHLFFKLLFMIGLMNPASSQTITGGCDKVTVTSFPSYTNNYNMNFFICPIGTGCRLQEQELSIRLYPNPATDYLIVQGLDHLHQGDIIKASITNTLGQVVKQIPHLDRTQIEVTDLSAGLYYLSIYRNDQKIASEKIVIK